MNPNAATPTRRVANGNDFYVVVALVALAIVSTLVMLPADDLTPVDLDAVAATLTAAAGGRI